MRFPNFLICGAQKSGSTALRDLIAAHPDAYFPESTMSSDPVALKFFSDDSKWDRGLAHYASMFLGCPPGKVAVGEKSISYMDDPRYAKRIESKFPQMKLLFILRNPVDRTFSHYRYSVQHGLEQRSFTEALIMETYREQNTPAPLRLARPWSYVDRSLYAKHLRPFYELFPKEQILVLFSDFLYYHPADTAKTVFKFLKLNENVSISKSPLVNSFTDRLGTHVTPSFTAEMSVYEKKYLKKLFMPSLYELTQLVGHDRIPVEWFNI